MSLVTSERPVLISVVPSNAVWCVVMVGISVGTWCLFSDNVIHAQQLVFRWYGGAVQCWYNCATVIQSEYVHWLLYCVYLGILPNTLRLDSAINGLGKLR